MSRMTKTEMLSSLPFQLKTNYMKLLLDNNPALFHRIKDAFVKGSELDSETIYCRVMFNRGVRLYG